MGFNAHLRQANFTLGPDVTLDTEKHKKSVCIKGPNSVSASKRKHKNVYSSSCEEVYMNKSEISTSCLEIAICIGVVFPHKVIVLVFLFSFCNKGDNILYTSKLLATTCANVRKYSQKTKLQMRNIYDKNMRRDNIDLG